MRNEIYAIRQGKDGIRYGATSYNAKPGYSNECKRIKGQWILSATGKRIPKYNVHAIVFVGCIIIGFLISKLIRG